jgi:acyl carrier protein
MEKEVLIEKISAIIKEKFLEPNSELSTVGDLHDEVGLDSLETIELCMALEGEFDININDDYVDNWGEMSIEEISEQILHLFNAVG